METIDISKLDRKKSLGKLIRIHHFKDLFNLIHEFFGDIKSFIILINVNKFFRAHCKFSKKICEVVEQIKKERYSLFSPYSWVSNKAQFFYQKKKQFQEKFDLNEYEFKILFNLSRRMINKVDFETFEVNSTFNEVLENYFYNQIGVTKVNFSRCKFPDPSDIDRCIKFIGKCYNVVEIDFQDNSLTPDNCKLIAEKWSKLSFLKDLNLKGCKIGYSGSIHIANFLKSHQTLQKLNLALNNLEYVGLKNIADIMSQSSLSSLVFNGNPCQGDLFSTLIENLFSSNYLSELHLNSLKLSNIDAMILSKSLSTNKSIKILSVNDNKIEATGFEAILATLANSNSTLENLDVSNNPIMLDGKNIQIIISEMESLIVKLKLKDLYIKNIGDINEEQKAKFISAIKNNKLLKLHSSYNI